ncbi:MAG: hypothetical protein IJ507_09380 [Clostridia bacterium]|nr:hypothetical protein [Clostridia bacterium]
MKRPRLPVCLFALTLAVLAFCLFRPSASGYLPPALDEGNARSLLRIWSISSVGGGESWLKERLRAFEKQHPGVMTYLRSVSPEELELADAVLPDLVLYTPGTLTAPQELFIPISGAGQLRESVLRCGRWQNQQYGLPLCWGGYVLCWDGALDPHSAATPAPTTLWGRSPEKTDDSAGQPGFPYEAILAADTPLLTPSSAGAFSLCLMPSQTRLLSLPQELRSPAEVYSLFRSRACTCAVLTTGQMTAFSALTSSGKGFAFGMLVPEQIITDQVWLGSVIKGAEDTAAPLLLSFLTSPESQLKLTEQGLHTVRESTKLYAAGWEAEVESAAGRSLCALNAYVPAADIQAAAWQVCSGQCGISEALLPLL